MLRPIAVSSVSFFLCLAASLPLAAAERAEREAEAKQLVREALHREIYGDVEARNQLLEEAAELAPNLDAARWHRGQVRFQNRWQSAAEVAESVTRQLKWTRYERERAEQPQTLAGQLALAAWCRHNRMPEQERAHLTAALVFDPDHADARARLGFRRLNGAWVSAEELSAAQERLAQESRALRKWQPKLEMLARDLQHRSQFRRVAAAERVAAINDPQAIPAMEAILSNHSETAADLVVQALGRMPSAEAVQSLVRHGVFSQWESVRTIAAERLRDRQRESYVPALLSSIYSPVVSRTRIARGDGGEILYRHTFFREGQDQRELLVLDTEFRRMQRAGGDRNETLGRAFMQLATTAFEREAQVARQNWLTRQMNERVAYVLNTATDQQRPPVPDQWWQWWNEQNEVFVVGEKTLETAYRSERVAVSDRPVTTGGGGVARSGGAQTMDCLAAGTPVWTATGLKAIEQIQVGDLVLSQDPQTGELAYKPVLQTTIRPRGPLVQVNIAGERIETSGGHLFWVSGEGWVKSRKLEPGMEVHTATGTRLVRDRESGSEQETYNLVVADFATYFVGPHKLLSHDNTIRETTQTVVPGLER